MTQLLQRQCVAIVGGLRVEQLRCQFKVKKDSGSKPNTAELSISNLARATRASLQQRGVPLIIQAGYPGTLATIFSGEVRTVDHVRRGSAWDTVIRSGDGERAYGFARVSKSYAAGVPVRVVLGELVASLGLDPGDSEALFATLTEQYVNGFVAHGKASAVLEEVLGALGLEWSVQDGRVQVLRAGGVTREEAVFLSPETGLLDSPEHGSGDGQKPVPKASVVKIRSLLQPRLKPGGRVQVESEGLKGVLRILSVEHVGDTEGGDWSSKLEAVPA